jgi:hypothetical protein
MWYTKLPSTGQKWGAERAEIIAQEVVINCDKPLDLIRGMLNSYLSELAVWIISKLITEQPV